MAHSKRRFFHSRYLRLVPLAALCILIAGAIPASGSPSNAALGLFGDIAPFYNLDTPSAASYASRPLGGPYFGNYAGLAWTPGNTPVTLTTSPTTMPAGLTAGTLNLQGDNSQAFVSGSLASGATHIIANSYYGTPETKVFAIAELLDGLTFHVPGGGSTNIGVGLAIDGSVSGGNPNPIYYQFTDIGLTGAYFAWRAYPYLGRTGYGVFSQYGWASSSLSGQSPTGFQFMGDFTVRNGVDVPIELDQSIECDFATNCDFLNTAQISLVLPPGVTFTSDSGVFLSQATPEPGTLVLLGSGFLAVAGAFRRKFMV